MVAGMYNTPPPARDWQNALNQSWPPGESARHIRDQPYSIDVWVRIVWSVDGEEWVSGRATRWTRNRVFVQIADPRWQTRGIWVVPADVRRR